MLTLGALLAGCGSDDAPPPPDGTSGGDGGAGGAPSVECAEDEVHGLDGCYRPGVPDTECGDGFEPNGDGTCSAVLPASCPAGQLAIPGETTCRDIAPCDAGEFGEVPASAIHVDAGAPPGGDGSEAAPFASITEAIDGAANGDVIGVAAGSYHEDLIVQGKQLELVGRCPAMVEVVGTVAALQLKPGADGTRISGLALTGSGFGAVMSGVEGVQLERLWVHDLDRGVDIEDPLGKTSVTIVDSLVENATGDGVYLSGAEVALLRSEVRGTVRGGTDGIAAGVAAFGGETGRASKLTVEDSVVRDNEHTGLYAEHTAVSLRRVVVDRTLPMPETDFVQSAVEVRGSTAEPSTVDVQQSFLRADNLAALVVFGAAAKVSRTSIVGGAGSTGRGIELEPWTSAPATLEMASSAIAAVTGAGLVAGGSSARVEGSVLRGVVLGDGGPQAIGISALLADGLAPTVHVVETLVAGCQGLGIAGSGDFTLERSRVRANLPLADGTFGRGVEVHFHQESGAPSSAVIHDTIIEDNHDIGLLVVGGAAELEGVVVRRTQARADGRYGDGIAVISPFLDLQQPSLGLLPTTASLRGVVVEGNARAGILNYSGSLEVRESAIRCNAIDLDGEVHGDVAFDFADGGGNDCACGDTETTCQVLSSALEVPEI